jgi:GT2 family glycosyltransferase
MELPELSIIVVSYGTRDMTLECLASLVEETRETAYEVIVVDNASPDGSPQAIVARFPDFDVLAQTDNLGFAAANNLAALNARGRYLLLLNPDTIVLDKAIDRLMAFARRRPNAGIWGGRTLFGDRTLNPTSCWRRQTLWNLLCRGVGLSMLFPNSPIFHSEGYGGWRRDSEREVDIVTGCLLLIEKTLWDRLGGFAPEFFMYGEDADLCLRAKALGYRPAITPNATIVHYGGATEIDSARKNKRLLAAKALLIRKYFSRASRPVALGLLALRPWLKQRLSSRRSADIWKDVWSDHRRWLSGRF